MVGNQVMDKGGRRAYAAISLLAAGALALTGCSGGGSKNGTGDQKDTENAKRQQSSIDFGDAQDSIGPAAEVPGAKPGGTVTVLQRDSYAHLDPAQIYVSDEGSLSSILHRGLTGYKATSNDGAKHEVVGDLATDSGTTKDGGKTWTYTLKDGVKWADGTPITSADLRQTFERLFAPSSPTARRTSSSGWRTPRVPSTASSSRTAPTRASTCLTASFRRRTTRPSSSSSRSRSPTCPTRSPWRATPSCPRARTRR